VKKSNSTVLQSWSSTVPRNLRQFFESSFETLRHEAPQFLERLCSTLSNRQVGICSGSETFCVKFQRHGVHVEDARPAEDVRLAVGRRTILALADGELTLEDALREDRLEFYGSVECVADFYDGLQIYIAGATRCRGFSRLLTDFRVSLHSDDHEVPYEPTTAPRS
jgi:hypothetical protein